MEEKPERFSHLDEQGRPGMVDVGHKVATHRTATARSKVILEAQILDKLKAGDELRSPKGPVFQTAILAGTMAVKKTADLIPLCHPLPLDNIQIDIAFNEEEEVVITCTVGTYGKTGVEMEALTGASVAALTVYDMCKVFSHQIRITETCLMEKKGGKSDFSRWR